MVLSRPAWQGYLTPRTKRTKGGLGVGWAMQDAMYCDGERALKVRGEAALKRMPPLRTALKAGVVIGEARQLGPDPHFSPQRLLAFHSRI